MTRGELEKEYKDLKALRKYEVTVASAEIEKLQAENAELKKQLSYLEDNLRVARKDRENLQLDVAKGLKEFVKDYPATALRYLANEKYVKQLTEAKEILQEYIRINLLPPIERSFDDEVRLFKRAEDFIKE